MAALDYNKTDDEMSDEVQSLLVYFSEFNKWARVLFEYRAFCFTIQDNFLIYEL